VNQRLDPRGECFEWDDTSCGSTDSTVSAEVEAAPSVESVEESKANVRGGGAITGESVIRVVVGIRESGGAVCSVASSI